METSIPVLETSRMLLRGITPEVYTHVIDTYTDEQLMEFFGFATADQLYNERQRRAQGASSYTSTFIYFLVIDKATNKTIGSAGFYRHYPNHNRGEIGYILTDENFRNRGLLKELLPVVIAYGFNEMNLHRIEAFVGPDNVPSLRLMELFGFTKEGHLRQHYFKDGKHEDSVVFSLLKSEWKS